MASKDLSTTEWEALVFAPLWVYTAVASAEGSPETSQFRRLTDELADASAQFGGSGAGHTAVETLRGNLDAMWAAYHADGIDPRRGLERARGVLRKVPESEGRAFVSWLLDLAVRIAEARQTAGEPAITEQERRAIGHVAAWLGTEPPYLGPATGT